MAKSWANFEDRVRQLAQYIWDRPCNPERVAGNNIDGVVEYANDIHIYIEMTEEDELSKVRNDVNKIVNCRLSLIQQGIHVRGFCVVNGRVTQGMKDAGAAHKINVLSLEHFSRQFFDFDRYQAARMLAPFGSAVDPTTGNSDTSPYVAVKYIKSDNLSLVDASKIAAWLSDGKNIVLLGEYGSGKSRCLKEVFQALSKQTNNEYHFPISIDLRESWGLRRSSEIIRRHMEELGLENLNNPAIKAFRNDCYIFLLDGFDELGSQAWSNNNDKLKQIRAQALEGVKDIILKAKSGVLITGREHYFNNNSEMLSALGLNEGNTILLKCRDEFSEAETRDFFKRLKSDFVIPTWLPRRPLLCQTIASLSEDEIEEMFGAGDNEFEFWNIFLHILCLRDARINVTFDADTIENILIVLARITRRKSANVGPITLTELQNAFEAVLGANPVEEASVLLQRLPGLGRVTAENNDRQFIDMYILDGLRAKDVTKVIKSDEQTVKAISSGNYINPLEDLGQRMLGHYINGKVKEYVNLALRCMDNSNVVLACDIAASLLQSDNDEVDFQGLEIKDGHFVKLDMHKTLARRLTITSSTFGSLSLPALPPSSTIIRDCLAEHIYGVTSFSAVPKWVERTSAEFYDSVESVSRIKQIELDPRHQVLVTIVRKTFFQRGSGRKEEALTRGLGQVVSPATGTKILNLLLAEDILSSFRGDEGTVYKPNRIHAGRMKQMLYELKLSQDPIWSRVSKI